MAAVCQRAITFTAVGIDEVKLSWSAHGPGGWGARL
jgi:hypothetical protein